MPPRKKVKTAAKAIDQKSSAEAANTGHADAVNTISSTEPTGIQESTGDADPTSSTDRRTTRGRSRVRRTHRSIDTSSTRTTRRTGKNQQSTLKRKARDEAQEGDDDADADPRPMQATPPDAEQCSAGQGLGRREHSSAVSPQASGAPATSAHLAIPQIPTNNDGSLTSAQPVQHGDIHDLAETRRILTSRDPNTDPNAAQMIRQIECLLRSIERNDANGEDYDQIRTMLRVRLDQVERNDRKKAPAIQPRPLQRELRLAFPATDDAPEHPFKWTQNYWAYQNDVQKAKAAPPTDRPGRKPFMLKGPDKKMITQKQCRERQDLLRVLQFDLLYIAYCLGLKAEKGRASKRQVTGEGQVLQKMAKEGLIPNFNGDLNTLSKIPNKVKLEGIRIGPNSSIFEGCQKPTKQQFQPLLPDEVAKMREQAENPQGIRHDFNKTRYDKKRGRLWYELHELEVLLREFAAEESSRADRTRTGDRIRALRELAQPLNDGSLPTEAKAKTLLSAQILHENIKHKDVRMINHLENWSFVHEFDDDRRQHKFFSMKKWLHRRPAQITSRDAAFSLLDEAPGSPCSSSSSSSFSSSSSSSPSPSSSPTPVERPPYASQILDVAPPYLGDADSRFAGRTPYDHPGIKETALEGSSTQSSYKVGSGMLIPLEILGADPRGRGVPDEHGFTHNPGSTMPRQQYGSEGQTRTSNNTSDGRIDANPSYATNQPQPVLPANEPTGKRPAPTDLASASKRVALHHETPSQGTALPGLMSAFQPSSTVPGQDAANARPQMPPPTGPLKDSRKRPPPIEPPSSRKKPFVDFRDHDPSSSSSGSFGSAGSSRYSGSVENDILTPRAIRTPMSATFRSPRKASAPPKEPEKEKIPRSELTEDDLFAIGFPEHFGPAKNKGGDVEPATTAVLAPVVSQSNVPRPVSSHALPGISGLKGNADKQGTNTTAAAVLSQPPNPRPVSSHNTFEIAHDSLGLPSFGVQKPAVPPGFGASSLHVPNAGPPPSFGKFPLLQPQRQAASTTPSSQTPPPPTAPASPRIRPPSTTRSSLPPISTQSPQCRLPTIRPENTADEDEDPSSETPSLDDDEYPDSDDEDGDPTPISKAVDVMRRAVSDYDSRREVGARHTRAEARILRSIRAKERERREEDEDDVEPSADVGGGTGGAPIDSDMPDEDGDEDLDEDEDVDEEIGTNNGGGEGDKKESELKTQGRAEDAEERETWTRGHAGVSTRGRVSLPPEDLPPHEADETENLEDFEQELMRQFDAEAEAEASSRVLRAPVARMVSEEPPPKPESKVGNFTVDLIGDNGNGKGTGDNVTVEGAEAQVGGSNGDARGPTYTGDTSGNFGGELGPIGSGADQIDWSRYPETLEAPSIPPTQDVQDSSNVDDLFEMEGETEEIEWDNEDLDSIS